MTSYKDIKEAQDILVEYWGNDGEKVIEECARTNPFKGSVETFLDHCIYCGSNWNGMFLSGIKALFPSVYNIIPNNMGENAFYCICAIMLLCGVDYNEG
jgi:hypothetical protein